MKQYSVKFDVINHNLQDYLNDLASAGWVLKHLDKSNLMGYYFVVMERDAKLASLE